MHALQAARTSSSVQTARQAVHCPSFLSRGTRWEIYHRSCRRLFVLLACPDDGEAGGQLAAISPASGYPAAVMRGTPFMLRAMDPLHATIKGLPLMASRMSHAISIFRVRGDRLAPSHSLGGKRLRPASHHHRRGVHRRRLHFPASDQRCPRCRVIRLRQ